MVWRGCEGHPGEGVVGIIVVWGKEVLTLEKWCDDGEGAGTGCSGLRGRSIPWGQALRIPGAMNG